jgi:1,4-dihydroxy-2-naphthoate octaprenyltransferase
MNLSAIVRSTRPSFLILSPLCVLLGAGIAVQHGLVPPLLQLALCLLGGLLAHIAVNALNEYQDFTSGLDLLTEKTPFSGGSGALPESPESSLPVLALAAGSLLISIAIGVWLAPHNPLPLLLLGLIGVLLIVGYTRWINRYPWLCLIAPGLGFGLVMVVGTTLALGGRLDSATWLVAAIPFFLVNNLLLLNQFPDIDADAQVGRSHLPIRHGTRLSAHIYLVQLFAALALILHGALSGTLPQSALLALLPLIAGLYAWRGAMRVGRQIGKRPHYLAANVIATLGCCAVLGLALLIV